MLNHVLLQRISQIFIKISPVSVTNVTGAESDVLLLMGIQAVAETDGSFHISTFLLKIKEKKL